MATVLAPDAALSLLPVCAHPGLFVLVRHSSPRFGFSGSTRCFSNYLATMFKSLLPPQNQNADNRQAHCCIPPRAAIYDKYSTCIEASPRLRSSQVCTLCQAVVSGRGDEKNPNFFFFFFDDLNAKSVCLRCSKLGSLPQCKLALYLTLGGIWAHGLQPQWCYWRFPAGVAQLQAGLCDSTPPPCGDERFFFFLSFDFYSTHGSSSFIRDYWMSEGFVVGFRLVFGHLCVFCRGRNIWRASADVDFHWLEADLSICFVVFSMNWEFGNIVCSVCKLYFTYFSSNIDKFLTSYKILLPQPTLKVMNGLLIAKITASITLFFFFLNKKPNLGCFTI